MGKHRDILTALRRGCWRKGRPAVDPVDEAGPRTLGELLARADLRKRRPPRPQPGRARPVDVRWVANGWRRKPLTARFRTGGPIAPADLPAQRWAPAVAVQHADWELAALWAHGAVAWLRGRGVEMDPASPVGGRIVRVDDHFNAEWLCPLVVRVDQEFERATGSPWRDLVCFDPAGEDYIDLPMWAGLTAYCETYNLELLEEATPAVELLGEIQGAWGSGERSFAAGEYEALCRTLEEFGFTLGAWSAGMKKIALGRLETLLPPVWRDALDGIRRWSKATGDNAWGFYGDAEACSLGTVGSHRGRPVEYFEWAAGLLVARKRLFADLHEFVTTVQEEPAAFWRRLARSVHAAIKKHPQWDIPLGTGKRAGKKTEIRVTTGSPLVEVFGGPGAGGCPPPGRRGPGGAGTNPVDVGVGTIPVRVGILAV